MKKRVTLEQFEAKHPGATWTAKSQRAYDAGEKECTQCKHVLPLSEYGCFLSEHGKKRFVPYCYDCGKQYHHRRKPRPPRPRTEKIRQRELKRYRENAEEIKQKKRTQYARRREMITSLILEETHCEVCGGKGAAYFWRSMNQGEWIVLHKGCQAQAERDGLIPKHKRLRKKKELRQ